MILYFVFGWGYHVESKPWLFIFFSCYVRLEQRFMFALQLQWGARATLREWRNYDSFVNRYPFKLIRCHTPEFSRYRNLRKFPAISMRQKPLIINPPLWTPVFFGQLNYWRRINGNRLQKLQPSQKTRDSRSNLRNLSQQPKPKEPPESKILKPPASRTLVLGGSRCTQDASGKQQSRVFAQLSDHGNMNGYLETQTRRFCIFCIILSYKMLKDRRRAGSRRRTF